MTKLKHQIVTKLKKKYCDPSQIAQKLKNSNCDQTQKHKLQQNSITQIAIKLKTKMMSKLNNCKL